MSPPRYGEYRDSGVDWLGEVPGHWEAPPLKYVVRFASGGTPSKANEDYWDGDVPWASARDLKHERLAETGLKITRLGLDETSTGLIQPGAVIILVRGMTLAHSFPVCVVDRPMAINQDLKAVYPDAALDTEFLAWALRAASRESLSRLDEAGHGTKALRMDAWTSMELPLPPLPEQRVIAAYLDRETGRIDAAVAEQRRLIALLREKRQATTSHAVTRGLDPAAPLKPSGIDWLGEVPAYWEVTRLDRLVAADRKIMYGIVLPGPSVEDGIPIVKGGDVKPNRLSVDLLNQTTPEIERPFARARLKPRDIVYSIRGTIGDAELVPSELEGANITQDVARVSPDDSVCNEWLLWTMRSDCVFYQLAQGSLGAAVRGINIYDLRRAVLALPPYEEQTMIAAYIKNAIEKLDTLTTTAQSAIDLLLERRAALISAAVTGKIDVRGLVADVVPADAA